MSLRSSLTATPADEVIRLIKYHRKQHQASTADEQLKEAQPSYLPPPTRTDRRLRDRDAPQSRIREIGRRAHVVGGLAGMDRLYREVAKALPDHSDAWLREELARLWQGIAEGKAS